MESAVMPVTASAKIIFLPDGIKVSFGKVKVLPCPVPSSALVLGLLLETKLQPSRFISAPDLFPISKPSETLKKDKSGEITLTVNRLTDCLSEATALTTTAYSPGNLYT